MYDESVQYLIHCENQQMVNVYQIYLRPTYYGMKYSGNVLFC